VAVAITLSTTINGTPYSDTTTFKFAVVHVNHPPTWISKNIPLPAAYSGVAYSQSLKNSVTDADGNALTFSISGPTWLSIDPQSGMLSGTPASTDVTANGGVTSWTVTATDPNKLSDTTTIQLQVLASAQPPTWTTNPIVLKDVPEGSLLQVDLSQYASDPNGVAMKFTQLDGPNWFSLNSKGVLQGTPGPSNVGAVSFHVAVSDPVSATANTAAVSFMVTPVNHPPYWKFSPVILNVTEDQAVTIDISQYAGAPDAQDQGKLTFSLPQSPTGAWAQLSSAGVFTGTPNSAAAFAGTTSYTARVATPEGLTADVTVTFKTTHVNHPPTWSANSITLTPNAKEGSNYSGSIAAYAKDVDPQDQGKLTFQKVGTAPAWLTVGTDGSLSGTPARADVGTTTFQVRVLDPSNAAAVTSVTLSVDKTTHPPTWRQNPVLLTDAFSGLNYRFDLSQYVTGEAGDTLNFSLISGPRWMAISANGVISGVPTSADVGKFSAVIQVADGLLTAQANATGQVQSRTQGPTVNSNLPVQVVTAGQTLSVSLNSTQFITNPDGVALTFALATTSDWVTLSSSGALVAKPTAKNAGDNPIGFTLTSAEGNATGVVTIRVLGTGQPPVWKPTTIAMSATSGSHFTGSLAGDATDPKNETLTFSKVAGGSWLAVAGNGGLDGTPAAGNVGINNFTVSACNTDGACANATLVVTVAAASDSQTVVLHLADPVTGAHAENLWVIDNSTASSTLVTSLKQMIGQYFDGEKAVSTSGVYLSADANKFDGIPITNGQNILLLPSSGNLVNDFDSRTDSAYSDGTCNNCDNSPIWTLHRFYARVPNIAEIYHKGYITAGSPMDVLIVTSQSDHYKVFATDPDEAPNDYALEFKNFHRFEQMPLRISVLAPAAGALAENDVNNPGDQNAYQTLVEETGGEYLATSSTTVMTQYAQTVQFRANAVAKKTIALSPAPKSATSLKVMIGSQTLAGNTGGASDAWAYDTSSGQITLNWLNIDPKLVVPGNDITVTYR
jgi:hypothetical protein